MQELFYETKFKVLFRSMQQVIKNKYVFILPGL